jgi:hypothetical protein
LPQSTLQDPQAPHSPHTFAKISTFCNIFMQLNVILQMGHWHTCHILTESVKICCKNCCLLLTLFWAAIKKYVKVRLRVIYESPGD